MTAIDLSKAQPDEIIKHIKEAIRVFGVRLLATASLASANGDKDRAKQIREGLLAEIEDLASRMDNAIDDLTTEDTTLGVTVLSALQVAVWGLEMYEHQAHEVAKADSAAVDAVKNPFSNDTCDGIMVTRGTKHDH
jgi:hypothetical protein